MLRLQEARLSMDPQVTGYASYTHVISNYPASKNPCLRSAAAPHIAGAFVVRGSARSRPAFAFTVFPDGKTKGFDSVEIRDEAMAHDMLVRQVGASRNLVQSFSNLNLMFAWPMARIGSFRPSKSPRD
jgi:hypothetical protein